MNSYRTIYIYVDCRGQVAQIVVTVVEEPRNVEKSLCLNQRHVQYIEWLVKVVVSPFVLLVQCLG